MKKKGFTLVELLAVIVILAIIALIAVPIIMNVVESSRKGAATSSAYGYIKGVNITYANELLLGNNFELEGTLLVDENGNINGHKVDVEGTTIKGGYLTYSNGKITEGCLTIGDYKVTIENDSVTETIKGACEVKEIEPKESPIEWFTFENNDADGTATITGFSDKYDIAYQNDEEGVHDIVIPSKSDTDKDVTIVGGIFQKVDEDSCTYDDDGNYNCNVKYNLNSIYLPNSIVEISDGSLSGLSLKNVRLSSKLQRIGNDAFGSSYDYLNDDISVDNLDVEFNYINEIIIPDSVTEIGDWAFYGNNFTRVTIPNSVTRIGNGAFYSGNLESVDLGNGVQTIGEQAFSYNNLTSVTIPDSVTIIKSKAFSGNNLTSVIISESVTEIGFCAFEKDSFSNPNLTKIINKTGKAFEWGEIVTWYGGYFFETGIVEDDYGNVEVTNKE